MDMPADMVLSEEWRQVPVPPLQIYIPGASDHGIPSPLNIPLSSPSPRAPRDSIHRNDFIHPQDNKLEFGTLGALPLEVKGTSQDHPNKSSSAANSQPSAPVSPVSSALNPGKGSNRMRYV